MPSVKELMHLPLQELLTAHPRRVFALACTYHFEDVAQKAAVLIKQRFVHADSWNDPWGATTASQVYPKKMPEIPSALYLRLIAFTQSDHVDPPTFCSPPHSPMPNMATITPRHITYSDADIVIRTRNGGWLEFYVHITFVMFSSRILKAEILELMDSHDIPGQLPVLELPESGTTLSVLLTLCYPSSDSDTLTVSLSDIPDLVDAGRKYEIYAVDGFCRRLIRKLERDDPFHAYSLAMKYEWHEEARVAAVRIARLNIEYQYHHCMETLEARLYYPLLEFCHEYRKRLRGISENTGYTTSFGTNGDGPTDLTQCQWLWQLEQSDMRDAAWALAASAQTAPDGTDQLQRLQMIHTRVVEELDKVCSSPSALSTASLIINFSSSSTLVPGPTQMALIMSVSLRLTLYEHRRERLSCLYQDFVYPIYLERLEGCILSLGL